MPRIDLRCALLGLFLCGSAGAATLDLLKDVGDNDVATGSSPVFLGAVGTRGYFSATPFNGTPRLYRTDGTPATTVPVIAATAISKPSDGMEVAGRLVFLASGNSDNSNEVWSTDGTDAGTNRLASTGNTSTFFYWLGADRASRGFLCHSMGGQCSLYVTNGTAAGTLPLISGRVVFNGVAPLMAGGSLYFLSAPSGTFDAGLWASDGTVPGTRELIAMAATTLESVSHILHVSAGAALVVGTDAQGYGVFSLELASGVATRLVSAQSITDRGVHVGALQFFVKDHNLWRTDGTSSGTFVLTDADFFNGVRGPLVVLGNRVLFNNSSATQGAEVWVTDGSVAGTQMLRETTPGLGGMAKILAATSTHAYFIAGDPTGSTPVQLWVTDATPAGTRLIPLGVSTNYTLPVTIDQAGTVAGDRVFFFVTHETSAPNGVDLYYRLFTSDLAGTAAVDLGPGGLGVPVGNSLLFTNSLDPSGREPWFSDGTPAGTQRLVDIAVSGQTNSSEANDFTVLGNRALFVADDGDTGRELWVTDGTTAGTTLVKDILAGTQSSNPSGLRSVGGLVYFVSKDTGGVSDGGGRLWRSDGTETGTVKLGDTRAYVGGGSTGGCANWSAGWGGRVWFFGESENPVGTELWSTDGTVGGTRREFLLPAETRFAAHCELHATANGLIFVQDTAPNTALWRSDGTLPGTVRIPGVRPAGVGSGAASMSSTVTVVDGIAYLLADGGDGLEPWRTNGTAQGTAQIDDLTVGTRGAQVYAAAPFGNGIVFMYSSEPGTADGLWRITSATSGAARIKSGWISQPPVTAGPRVFFLFNETRTGTSTESLWSTDGTAPGTHLVFSAGAGSGFSIGDFLGADGLLFFTGNLAGSTDQLWVTNGTPGNPRSLGALPGFPLFPPRSVLLQGLPLLAIGNASRGIEPYIVHNAAPVALPDSAVATSGGNVLVNVRSNDTDADSIAADLAVTIATAPSNGTAVVESGSVRYTPSAAFTGTDTFQYRLTDELASESAVVTVTVTVNAAPSGGGAGGGGGGGGGGSLDLVVFAMLATFAYRRHQRLFRAAKSNA